MSRRDAAWLADILAAIDAIEAYVAEGSLSKGMVYDACRVRLIEIGEAVKNIDPNLLATISVYAMESNIEDAGSIARHYSTRPCSGGIRNKRGTGTLRAAS